MENIENFMKNIQDESVEYLYEKKHRKLVELKQGQVRKRKDGYYNVAVQSGGRLRTAIVPEDTIERMLKEGTSPRVLKDRCNTLSALGNDFDKPLMYYAIVAYDLVNKEEWSQWVTSNPLLLYELVHLNGDIDDIRKENVRLTNKDEALWQEIKSEYKTQNKVGADKEYTKRREEYFRSQYSEYPNLKVMTRVTDVVKKTTAGITKDFTNNCKGFIKRE